MRQLSEYLSKDFSKYGIEYKNVLLLKYMFGRSIALKFLCWFRLTQCCEGKISRKVVRQILMQIERKYGLEIPDTVEVGKGFYLGHPYGITVNPEVIL